MGTSHRHTPTVKGEPNWGKASAALTGLTGDVEESDELQKNPPDDKTPAQVEKRQNQLGKRISRNYHTSVRKLVKASGGRHTISSGGSRALGRGGIAVINNFISVIQEIVSNGLTAWLQQRGISSLEDKSCQNIIDFLRQYVESGVAGLDSTAANEAIENVMDRLQELVGDNVDEIEDKFDAILNGEEIKNIIDYFFGMYVYVHLSQDFEEKLEYEKGRFQSDPCQGVCPGLCRSYRSGMHCIRQRRQSAGGLRVQLCGLPHLPPGQSVSRPMCGRAELQHGGSGTVRR